MQQLTIQRLITEPTGNRVPDARYAYYRRCQVFRRNGEQCKAPAEKGALICHAHASQLSMAIRRERERRAVLAEAVAEMCRRGRPECEMADLFTSFKGIQVTTAVMARAVITGKIDCKTAGQMVVHLQTMSKLLWHIHHKERKGRKDLPLIHTDTADLKKLPKAKLLTTKDTKEHEGLPQICADERGPSKAEEMMSLPVASSKNIYGRKTPDCAGATILPFEVTTFRDRSWAHGPPGLKAA